MSAQAGDNYIQHKETGKKIAMRRKGGSYILKVTVLKKKVIAGEETKIFMGRA